MSQPTGGGSGRGEWTAISIVGVVLILVGAVFLVDQLGIFHLAFRGFLPILLIVVGAVVLINVAGRRRTAGPGPATAAAASSIQRDGAGRLELEVGVGGGTFRLGGGSNDLVEVRSSAADIAAQQRREGNLAQVRLRQDVARSVHGAATRTGRSGRPRISRPGSGSTPVQGPSIST